MDYHTSIYINQATTAGNGSIGHALALLASNSNFYIMVGYEDLASAAILQGCSNVGSWYFLEQDDASRPSHQCLVAVPTADFGQYADVSIEPNGSPPTATSFTYRIATQTTNQTSTVNIPLWPSGEPQFASAEFGERLIGSQGASATTVLFYNNSWLDQSRLTHLQSFDGGVTASNPPFGNWVTPPSQSTGGDGGEFFAECCVAPDTVCPVTVVFSTTPTGTTSAPATVLITNNINSAGALNITGITMTGANASDFKIASNRCGSSLPPLNNCSLTITFTPTATGTRTATLSISDNGGSGSGTDTAALTGTGGRGDMKVRKQLVLDLALAAPVIVLGVFIAHQFHQLPVQAQTLASKLKLPPLPKGPVSYPAISAQQPQGAPAIRPAKGNLSSDEVQQFLTSHSAPVGIKALANATIGRVDCGQTVGRVSAALPGKTLGLSSDMPVCYVELTGNFT